MYVTNDSSKWNRKNSTLLVALLKLTAFPSDHPKYCDFFFVLYAETKFKTKFKTLLCFRLEIHVTAIRSRVYISIFT